MPAADRHLAKLPDGVRKLVEAQRSPTDTTIAVAKAFALLGLPQGESRRPIFPRPSELTDEQHALASFVVERGLDGKIGPMPGGETARRWLGLDPPGPFEREIEWKGARMPLWLAFQREDHHLDEVLCSLPIVERIEAIASFALAEDYELGQTTGWTWETEALREVKGEGGDWASGVLDSSDNDDRWEMHREHVAYLVAVRAGVPLAEAWDRFFPIGSNVPASVAAECAPALPLERMEAVAAGLLESTHGHRAIQSALEVLRHHDAPSIARFVIEKSKKSYPHDRKRELAALAEIAATKPAVAAVLGKGRAASAAPARTVTVTSRLAPRAANDLTPLQTKQLVEAGRRWDRKTLPASRRLSLDENDEAAFGAVLEHVTLAERGKPAYEAWLVGTSSGTFFTAGTTNVVGERIDGVVALEGKPDPALSDALSAVSVSKSALRPASEVRKATKPLSTKERAAKKPAAKKPAPKTQKKTSTARATKSAAARAKK